MRNLRVCFFLLKRIEQLNIKRIIRTLCLSLFFCVWSNIPETSQIKQTTFIIGELRDRFMGRRDSSFNQVFINIGHLLEFLRGFVSTTVSLRQIH